MELYIANCTKQHHEFLYRLPQQQVVRMLINAGSQIVIKNLDKSDADYIINSHSKYGLVSQFEANRRKTFVGQCYSIDSPVAFERIEETLDKNEQAMQDKSDKMISDAVAATESVLQEQASEAGVEVKNVEFDIKEQKTGPSDNDKKMDRKFSTKEGKKNRR